MAFKDRFAITQIVNEKVGNLSISIDTGTFRIGRDEVGAVLLYTPSMTYQDEHYHIELKKSELIKLRDWISDFLSEENIMTKFERDIDDRKR